MIGYLAIIGHAGAGASSRRAAMVCSGARRGGYAGNCSWHCASGTGPGYLHAALFNDVGGRFESSLVTAKSRWFYINQLRAGFIAAAPLVALSPARSVCRSAGGNGSCLLYALCIVVATLGVFTCAASKLNHYILPAVPVHGDRSQPSPAAVLIVACGILARLRGALRPPDRRTPAARGDRARAIGCRGSGRAALLRADRRRRRAIGTVMARSSRGSRRTPIDRSSSSIPASCWRASYITRRSCSPIASCGRHAASRSARRPDLAEVGSRARRSSWRVAMQMRQACGSKREAAILAVSRSV